METTYSAKVSIEINAAPEQVWEVLINPDLVRQYLHGATMNADWRKGDNITWSGEWNGQSYVDKGTVLIYEPYSVIKTTHWSPMSGKDDKPENYHHVTYELKEENNKTTFTLTQENSPKFFI
ncbi:MAG: SRPBCC family protein [Candidatus Saccharimonadales bacterium]